MPRRFFHVLRNSSDKGIPIDEISIEVSLDEEIMIFQEFISTITLPNVIQHTLQRSGLDAASMDG